MNILNEELYKECKAFVKRALSLLRKKSIFGIKIPREYMEDISQEGKTITLTKSLFGLFIQEFEDQIENLDEIDSTLDLLKETQDEKAHPIDLLVEYVEETGSLKFNKKLFKEIYIKFENFVYSDTLKHRIFAPLSNFKCEVDEINLGNRLKISRITVAELNEMWNTAVKHGEYGSIRKNSILFLRNGYAIKMEYDLPKNIKLYGEDKSQLFNQVITALRLFKPGSVGINAYTTFLTPGQFYRNYRNFRFTSGSQGRYFGGKYILKKNEIEDFKNLWKKISGLSLENWRMLEVALKRFGFAYEKPEKEDRIIDFFISFEALLTRQKENQNINQKISNRTANLLEENLERQSKIEENMRNFYKIRSYIVHGNFEKFSKDDVENCLPEIEEILRRVLNKFIDNTMTSTSYDEIIREIEGVE